MSQAPDSQRWEHLKHIMRTLYIGKGHTLDGPEGVLKLMETRHGFKATKAQYEKQFKEWGFQKKRTKEDWKVIGQKIGARKRMGKESNLYIDGQLVPTKKVRKEISRQGYMSVCEQFSQAQEPPPGTPPGCEIRTPVARPLSRLIFENLPIFQFREMIAPSKELIRPFDTGSSTLTPLLERLQRTKNPDSILPIINSLLPNSAFLGEECANGLAIERVEMLGPAEIFNLMMFLISNNFPGGTRNQDILKWLKKINLPLVLKVLSSIETPTAEALLEKLFEIAVERGDASVVKHLTRVGVNPNDHWCLHPSLPGDVTPLQYALSRGNTELAQELIKAGSSIDEVGTGWKSSALVLAIIGENLRGGERFWQDFNDSSSDDSHTDIWSQAEPGSEDFAVYRPDNDPFIDLIQSLLNAGAAINLDDRSCSAVLASSKVLSPFLEGHSPLTAASKYRHKELVDMLLQRGADVKFLMGGGASALHECLYSWEEMYPCSLSKVSLKPLSQRVQLFPGSVDLSKLIDVARSLISAGAEVNDESANFIDENRHGYQHCTTLDLSVLTGSAELVEMMLSAGAYTTTDLSMEHAIHIGSLETVRRLLNIGAPLSTKAVGNLMRNDESCLYATPLLEKRPNIRIKRAIFHEAIRLGATSTIEYILKTETSGPQKLIYGMTEAFETCCAKGDIDTLRLLLTKASAFKVSIYPWLGRALELAIRNSHDDLVDILLSADPDVNVIMRDGETALLEAIRKKSATIVRKLISAGVRLNKNQKNCSRCKGHDSNDLLIAAIEWGNYPVINSLLNVGASLQTLGTTNLEFGSRGCVLPLTASIMAKDMTLVNHIISAGAAVNNPPQTPWTTLTPLSAAIKNRDLDLVNELIYHGANPYDSEALTEATNEFRLFQVLLTALHNFDEPSNSYAMGRRALHKAIVKQDQFMIQTVLNSPFKDMKSITQLSAGLLEAVMYDFTPNFEIIGMFLSLGADPNSALYMAIEKNDLRKFQLLLEAGSLAGKNQTTYQDFSLMQLAIKRKNPDILRKLLEYGFDPNVVSSWGKTPIQLATEESDMEMIKVLLQYRSNPNAGGDGTTHTPLQIASRDGSKEILDLLLEKGADVNSSPARNCGATALQFAARNGFLGIAHLLLENGADVNAPPAEIQGRTALEGAVEHGRIDMVQLLLNAGANIFQEGQLQIENAMRGHNGVRRLLELYHG